MSVPERDGSGESGGAGDAFPPRRPPVFNNMPAGVVVLLVAIVGVTLADWMMRGTDMPLIAYGAVFSFDAGQPWGRWPPLALHVFFHAGLMHLLFNAGAMLAFGAGAARPFASNAAGQAGFPAFFFACSIAGAVAQIMLFPSDPAPMIGASTGLSGCIAGAGYAAGGRAGMIRLALPWALINVAIAAAGVFADIPISWAGHMGGLAAGVILYPVFGAVFGFGPLPRRH